MPYCEIELVKVDPDSPGIVLDEENICRGAYGPPPSVHYKANKRLKVSQLVRTQDLVGGNVSVWRAGDQGHLSQDDLLQQLNLVAPAEQETYLLFSINVKALRERRIDEHEGRVFCVTDDCVCDAAGNKHPAHASVGLCQTIKQLGLTAENPLLIAIKETLVLMLQTNVIWRHADAPD